jgi:hypothetical protein
LIIDNSITVSPEKIAAALRQRGMNARSVKEIFGVDPGDREILELSEQLGGRVVTFDKGADLAGGFSQRAIRIPGRVRSEDSIIRLVEEALKK